MTEAGQRLLAMADRHPVRAVAAVGSLVVLGHLWWLERARPANTWNADEAGYLADALRFERSALDGLVDGPLSLGPLWDAMTSSANAPLVPLASAAPIAILGRSVSAAMVVAPLLHLVAAVAVAGVVVHLASPRRALWAGAAVLAMPGAILAGRSYVFAGAVAALLASAVWALLASDRGRRLGPMVAFGLCLGALPLARTMAVAFLPGLVLAAALHVRRDRIGLRNAVMALAVALVVGVPWWLATWSEVTGYLVDYGYGAPAADYGEGGVLARLGQRLGTSMVDVRPLLLLPGLVWLVAGLLARRSTDDGVASAPRGSERAAAGLRVVVVVLASGVLALLTSGNSGIWFELPLLVLAVAGVAALEPRSAGLRRALGVAVAAACAVNLLAVGVVRLGASAQFAAGDRTGSAAMFLFGDMYQPVTSIRTRDPLLLSDPADRRAVGAAWREAHQQVVDELQAWRDEMGGGLHLTVTGSSSLMSLNTLRLQQELTQRPADGYDAPDSGVADLDRWLTPTVGVLPRALVVVESVEEAFPLDRGADRVLAAAAADGWEERAVVALPDGGDARVLVPPPTGG